MTRDDDAVRAGCGAHCRYPQCQLERVPCDVRPITRALSHQRTTAFADGVEAAAKFVASVRPHDLDLINAIRSLAVQPSQSGEMAPEASPLTELVGELFEAADPDLLEAQIERDSAVWFGKQPAASDREGEGAADLDALEARINKAHAMVSDLCKPAGTMGARSWRMSIPAQPESDPDLVITDGLRAGATAIETLRASRAAPPKDELAGWVSVPRQLISDWAALSKALGLNSPSSLHIDSLRDYDDELASSTVRAAQQTLALHNEPAAAPKPGTSEGG